MRTLSIQVLTQVIAKDAMRRTKVNVIDDFYDPDHSVDEHRYLIIGTSTGGRLLITSYTERAGAVRLISAREVTSSERKAYEEG